MTDLELLEELKTIDTPTEAQHELESFAVKQKRLQKRK